MTIHEAITEASAQTKQQLNEEMLVGWLSALDGMVKHDLIDLYEGGEAISFTPYDPKTDMEKQLLVPFPYDEAYVHYLIQQIQSQLEENTRANNASDLFQNAFYAYRMHYVRTHMPKQRGGFKV